MKKHLLKFISPSSIKLEIAHVYKKGNIAVATDSYKLLEIKLEDQFATLLPDGYYTKEEWKILANDKKKDLWERVVLTPRPTLGEYPDYSRVIPESMECEAYKGKLAFNFSNLKDFLDARNESERLAGRLYRKDLYFDPNQLLENSNKMLYHKNENATLLLMAINN